MSAGKTKSALIASFASQQPVERRKKTQTIKETINQIITECNLDNYSLDCKDDRIFLVGNKGDQTFTLKVEQTRHGESIEATEYSRSSQKSDLTPDIVALRKHGRKTQAEVADILGISQSYVSLLKRQHRKKLKTD